MRRVADDTARGVIDVRAVVDRVVVPPVRVLVNGTRDIVGVVVVRADTFFVDASRARAVAVRERVVVSRSVTVPRVVTVVPRLAFVVVTVVERRFAAREEFGVTSAVAV